MDASPSSPPPLPPPPLREAGTTVSAPDSGPPLFGLASIAVASIVGSALAGVWLISMNYAAQGRYATAWLLRLVAVPMFALAALEGFRFAVNANSNDRITVALAVVVIVPAIMYLLADWAHGRAIRARAAAGLAARPWWLALLVAMAFMLLAIAFPLILMLMFTVVGLVEAT
ncbi:hypothetical protein [Lysobacter sp. Root690]|uniref:hypothetical protein n=1 Tax=Lysobacter sp. Root690 TaxID=1736588 RepID=UPI0006FB8874|nr:hypothetical protein [Lysobacter sp. Root690]KRB11480.1 hypothetical protein ASD86_03475 [Lysobacter sp. Root690]